MSDEIKDVVNEEFSLEDEVFLEERKAELKVIDELTAERDSYKEKYLYALAEMENAKKRIAAEKPGLIETGEKTVIKEIINIIDDFERAIQQNKSVNDAETLKTGFEILHDKFIKSLKKLKVEAISSTGEPFDTDIHEAIASIPVNENNADKAGLVYDTVRVGYKYKDSILRHAGVVVYTKPKD